MFRPSGPDHVLALTGMTGMKHCIASLIVVVSGCEREREREVSSDNIGAV